MEIASGESLDARLTRADEILAKQLALEQEVDQIPVAVIDPVGWLLGDSVDLLGDLVAQ